MLTMDQLMPWLFAKPPEAENDAEAEPLPKTVRLMIGAWLGGYGLFALGVSGLLAGLMGWAGLFAFPLLIGLGLMACNGWLPLRAILAGGLVNFPPRDWTREHGRNKGER